VFDEIDDWEGSFSSMNDELKILYHLPYSMSVPQSVLAVPSLRVGFQAFAQMAIDH